MSLLTSSVGEGGSFNAFAKLANELLYTEHARRQLALLQMQPPSTPEPGSALVRVPPLDPSASLDAKYLNEAYNDRFVAGLVDQHLRLQQSRPFASFVWKADGNFKVWRPSIFLWHNDLPCSLSLSTLPLI